MRSIWRFGMPFRCARGFSAAGLLLVALCGCRASHPVLEPYGKTFYLDGAGDWGFGRRDVPEGLRRAGYRGDCVVFDWSTTRNPLLDQLDPLGLNKLSAQALASRIRKYKQKYPDNDVNLIALSAGTGVVVWALERLKGEYKVNNVFLVGSSLASSYDMDQALRSVEGKVFVYHSPRDAILPLTLMIGTVDRRLGARVVGLVGLALKDSYHGRVVNIGWEKKWNRLGWKGGHTDCVGRAFVQYEIARKLMVPPTRSTGGTEAQAAKSGAGSRNESSPEQRSKGDVEIGG